MSVSTIPQIDQNVTVDYVKQETSYSDSYIHALIAKKVLPAPFKMTHGGRRNYWKKSEIDAYVQARVAARDHSTKAA